MNSSPIVSSPRKSKLIAVITSVAWRSDTVTRLSTVP